MRPGPFVFVVETGESRTPRLDLSRVHFRYDLFYVHEKLVGVARFELTTPRSQSGCATTAPHPDLQITQKSFRAVLTSSVPGTRKLDYNYLNGPLIW